MTFQTTLLHRRAKLTLSTLISLVQAPVDVSGAAVFTLWASVIAGLVRLWLCLHSMIVCFVNIGLPVQKLARLLNWLNLLD